MVSLFLHNMNLLFSSPTHNFRIFKLQVTTFLWGGNVKCVDRKNVFILALQVL